MAANAMAFPIPEHLPQKPKPVDISTQILTKISDTSLKLLNASLASTWVQELDKSIREAKEQIHARINEDLPAFNRYLASSISAQERLQSLTQNVNALDASLNESELGVVPSLVRELSAHAELAQKTAGAAAVHNALSHLHICETHRQTLTKKAQEGQLAEAAHAARLLETALLDAPKPLRQATIFAELQNKHRILMSRVEEQLGDVYTQAITIETFAIRIVPSVPVGKTMSTISFPDVLSSLSTTALTAHLTVLRRDLITYYIERTMSQPASIEITKSSHEVKLVVFPDPPSNNLNGHESRLENLQSILEFVSSHLISALPERIKVSFARDLSSPISEALLKLLLIPALPSSADALKSYLALVRATVAFESTTLPRLLGPEACIGVEKVQRWAIGVGGHYARKRRADILAAARTALVAPEDKSRDVKVEISVRMTDGKPAAGFASLSDTIVEQGDEPVVEADPWGFGDAPKATKNTEQKETVKDNVDAWDFDQKLAAPVAASVATDKKDDFSDSWGFDDELAETTTDVNKEAQASPPSTIGSLTSPPTTIGSLATPPSTSASLHGGASADASPPAKDKPEDDAWGFDEGDKPADDSGAWDNPWGESSSPPQSKIKDLSSSKPGSPKPVSSRPSSPKIVVPKSPALRPVSPPSRSISPQPALSPGVVSPTSGPKRATRLERLANKSKGGVSGTPSPITPLGRGRTPSPQRSVRATSPPPRPKSPLAHPATPPMPNITAALSAFVPAPVAEPKPTPSPQHKPSPIPVPATVRETYVASSRAKDVLNVIESAIREGRALSASDPFQLSRADVLAQTPKDGASNPATLVLQAASSALELFRGLYTVQLGGDLKSGAAMKRVNDALYLSDEVARILRTEGKRIPTSAKIKLEEARDRLKSIGEAWFEDALDKQEDALQLILSKANHFTDTGDQDTFDTCEETLTEALRAVRGVAPQWKAVLPRTKYLASLGALVDSMLTAVLEDVLALGDIPEVESHRLAELCRMLGSLEGLFVEGSESSLAVAYVPSWLKFSYLSELLEASIADIMYLFDEGALVDFSIEELVKLVRALFADTPLRTNAINRFMAGHPIKT